MNLFSFDAETDGLYGDVWAIGAVVLDATGKEIDSFGGQVATDDLTNQWVIENVAPYVMLPHYESRRALRDAFWAFWMRYHNNSIAVADFGAPVEANLFRRMVEDDPKNRYWSGPYPLHELGTALALAGLDPDIDRIAFTGMDMAIKHDPVWDARVSAIAWRMAAKRINVTV